MELLEDLSTFFGSLAGLLAGFRERAEGVKALLGDPATAFVIVASPQHEPVSEAIYFGTKLRDAGMPFAGLVVNRVREPVRGDVPAGLPATLAAKVREAAADRDDLAARDAAAIERLERELGTTALARVPQLSGDVHDVDGLVALHAHLFSR